MPKLANIKEQYGLEAIQTFAPMGKEHYKSQQLQKSQDFYFKMYRTQLNPD